MKRSKIDCIFLSHFDTDHYTGLLGLISTLQLQRRERNLTIVGPKGVKEYLEWNLDFANIDLNFEIDYVELEEGFEEERVVDGEDFYVEARPLKHTKFCIGYRYQEKDKPGKVDADEAARQGITEDWQFKELKAGNDVELDDGTVVESTDIVGHPRPGDSFAYVMDTEYCRNSVKLAMNTNVLYHEATFGSSLDDKASETGHSTASDAARVANEAQTKLLVISHFSARYTNQFVLLREAREKFHPTWVATELRPIMTDPQHEKGIIQPKVFIKEYTPGKGKGKKNYKKRRSSSSGGRKKRFRKRRSYSKSNSSGGGHNKRPSRDNRDRYRKANKNRYKKDNGNKNNDDDRGRKPKPITPRTPFDDFNRF